MATPHAVSAVAILKSYNKNLTLDNVIELLKSTAVDLGEEGWDEYYGYGLISFDGVEFREDNVNTDEYKVYKKQNDDIINIELSELILTRYNYYSITNLMGSKVKVYYSDNTSEEMLLCNLPNLTISNYNPRSLAVNQTVTISTGNVSMDIDVTNPRNYQSGWEYEILPDSNIGAAELTGYKDHGLEINKLYIPLSIDSSPIVALGDNVKFNDISNDFLWYEELYLSSNFRKIGDYSLSNTNIKHIYGEINEIEIGSHALEASSLIKMDIPIKEIGESAFKDCFDLTYVNLTEKISDIPNYTFYNCKKLKQLNTPDNLRVNKIGKYAFYNCISLSRCDIMAYEEIGEYSFANCFNLFEFKFNWYGTIGEYAFYYSGLANLDIGAHQVVGKSAFENCKNLKSVDFRGSKRIESRTFWNSGIEIIYIASDTEYIAEDAFAYCPIIKSGPSSSGDFYGIEDCGIIEKATNKLIVGFKGREKNTTLPDSVTEIGNYAFTGNYTIETIIIPESVTKIGDYAFKDCYKLVNVYMLGNDIEFGNDTFVKTYEGEIANDELFIYIHKDNSNIREYIRDKNLEYRNIEPDEIIVIDNKEVYRAFDKVDKDSLIVKLIYHEENDREEVLSKWNDTNRSVLTNLPVGFEWCSGSIEYGETYYTLLIRNKSGYEEYKNVEIEVIKAIPNYNIPKNLTGSLGQKLSEIALPNGFEWMNGDEVINEAGDVIFKARYTPSDIINYEIVENIDITISVENTKTVLNPNISLGDKTYDGTTQINTEDITISNLDNSEYSIVSAILSSANVGERTATIKLRLSDEKYEEYSFDNGKQEKEFEVPVNVIPADSNIQYSSANMIHKYDGESYGIDLKLESPSNAIIKYANENDEYILDEMPKYKEIGKYTIKYRIYINENYTDVFGENTVTIIEDYVLGDINGDGKVNIKDWNRLYEHINETSELSEEEFLRADVNKDGKVNIKDWNRLYEHINETNPLW